MATEPPLVLPHIITLEMCRFSQLLTLKIIELPQNASMHVSTWLLLATIVASLAIAE